MKVERIEPIEVEDVLAANDDGTWVSYVYGFADEMGRKICGEVSCRGGWTGIVVEGVKVLDEDGREVDVSDDVREAMAREAVKG